MSRPKGSKNKSDLMIEIGDPQSSQYQTGDYVGDQDEGKGAQAPSAWAPQSSQEEKVTLTRQELEELIDSKLATVKMENDKLRQNARDTHERMGLGEWREEQAIGERQHDGFLKLYRQNSDQPYGLVVFWKLYEIKKNPLSGRIEQELYKIKCLYEDGSEKEFIIPLLELGQLQDRENVKIIEEERKKLVKIHGKVRRATVDTQGYTRSYGLEGGSDLINANPGAYVDLKEIRDETFITIKRASGQTYRMNVKYINS